METTTVISISFYGYMQDLKYNLETLNQAHKSIISVTTARDGGTYITTIVYR